MATLFPTYPLGVDFKSPSLAGQYMDVFKGPSLVDFSQIETEKTGTQSKPTGKKIAGMTIEEFDKLDPTTKAMLMFGEAQKSQERYRREERDPEFLREQGKVLDEINAKQMARAQKYGKESAFYGFMYGGLPKLMAQAAFSKYAFAPEMIQGVQNAYSRIDGRTAVSPTYMSINPRGGIG